jgi:uncharacterized protein (DUF362 family)
VSDVYEVFERQLEGWRRLYAGRPDREMVRLCLLSLEREEIVSVVYHEDVLRRRVQALDAPPEVRDLVRHALVWAWKDEEMHAIYIRGALLRLGSPRLRAATFLRQMAGAVGGWAGSVRQHVRWREAPFSRAAATALTWAGLLAGQVPPEVRRHLDYGSFRDFCLFNVDAERTAWLCWHRLTELAPQVPELSGGQVADFARVEADEDRHRRIFHILAEAFDAEDRLVPGETAATLAEKIGAVGEFFLPRARRRGRALGHPLGQGGRVHVTEARPEDDKRAALRRIVEEAGLAAVLARRAGETGKAIGELEVAIKPTFMLGYHRRDLAILTDPDLLDELAHWLRDQGVAAVRVLESSNIYDQFFAHRSVPEVARYFGLASPHYEVVDASADQVPHEYFRGMAQYSISRAWKEADVRISFGKMRSHPVELVYLTVANVEWMGGRCDRFLFVERQAHRETAIMMLLDEFPPHFALLDGFDLAADGLVGVMGCHRPPRPRRLYAAADALALDMVAARHLGMKEPRDSSLLEAACHWFGGDPGATEVVGCDEPVAGWRGPYHSELTTLLSFVAFPVYVLGSGRGALFVPEMDPQAFPLLEPEGWALAASRRAVRAIIGLRLPA